MSSPKITRMFGFLPAAPWAAAGRATPQTTASVAIATTDRFWHRDLDEVITTGLLSLPRESRGDVAERIPNRDPTLLRAALPVYWPLVVFDERPKSARAGADSAAAPTSARPPAACRRRRRPWLPPPSPAPAPSWPPSRA